MPDPLDFGIDLDDVAERVKGLGYFLTVGDLAAAVDAIEGRIPFKPPAAFVSLPGEQAEGGNTISAGGYSQTIGARVSILFCEKTDRADGKARASVDRTRKALMRQLTAWTPLGAGKALEYDRYQIRQTGAGLIWAEVLFLSRYRFDQ